MKTTVADVRGGQIRREPADKKSARLNRSVVLSNLWTFELRTFTAGWVIKRCRALTYATHKNSEQQGVGSILHSTSWSCRSPAEIGGSLPQQDFRQERAECSKQLAFCFLKRAA